MTWIQSLFAFRNARQVQEATDQLVTRAWPWVWQRVAARVPDMSPAEARGYVRAHSSELVRSSAASLVSKHPTMKEWAIEAIVEQTLDGLVSLCLIEMVQIQRQQMQQRLVRRAA